jgi:hypothetical protein
MSSGSPQETGIPVRYPSVALLCVDSSDTELFNSSGYRIDDTSPSQIYINKQRPLMFGYMTRLALTEMDVVWDVPNINRRNNTITFKLYAYQDQYPLPVPTMTTSTYVIPPGFYNNDDLADTIETALNADVFSIANGLNFSVTVTPTGAFDIRQTSQYAITNRFKGGFQVIKTPGNEYDLLDLMGLTPVNTIFTNLTGGVAPMCYTPFVDVVSNLLTKNQNVTDGATTTKVTGSKLARIYFSNEQIQNVVPTATDTLNNNLIGTTPFFFRREFNFPKQIQWNSTENIDVIDIQVLDYKGNPVYIEPTIVKDDNTQPLLNEYIAYQEGTIFRFTIMATEV